MILYDSEKTICSFCEDLPKNQSFVKRIQRANEASQENDVKSLPGRNNGFLSDKIRLQKLAKYRKVCESQRLKMYNLCKTIARLRSSRKTLLDRIGENANRGDVSAIINDLNSAYEKGLLSGKSKVLQFISNIVKHFQRKSPRYNSFTKQIYSCLRIIGGPRAARFMSKNLGGPSDDTQRRTKRKFHFNYHPEKLSDRVFQNLARMYGNIKRAKKIVGNVLVETAEDETVIIGKVEWDSKTDQGWGWCGRNGDNHVCQEGFVHVVGADDDAYQNLTDAFKNNCVAGYARAILINPIHKDLPPLVALLQAVCNKFDHHFVHKQWREIQRLYDRHLLHVLGPLVGHASDGDSRRRKFHLANSFTSEGLRYQIDNENFTMSAAMKKSGDKVYVSGLSDQDFIHNSKKLVNHLMHPSRIMYLGKNICHVNHLQLLMDHEEIARLDHGLQQPDIDRRDRMNWESAQCLLFPKVRECLQKIQSGAVQPQENVIGTLAYLNMAWRYVEIFYSLQASLEERVSNASYVCNFLRIWRLWVFKTKGLALKENFLSRETFQDVTISCHHVVLFMKAYRDFAPNYPLEFQRLGSDVCEEFFSANGSFVVNKHNYTITDMFCNLNNMQFLQEMFADSDGPENPKRHRKGENIWKKGHQQPEIAPDLRCFPSDASFSSAWEKGLKECQDDLRKIGIKPDDELQSSSKNSWFFSPHLINATNETQIME